jgi:hypothetical protein
MRRYSLHKTIIQNINTIGTFEVEFLDRNRIHWCAEKQIGPRATSIDVVFIEELKEDKIAKLHCVEA